VSEIDFNDEDPIEEDDEDENDYPDEDNDRGVPYDE
jgi:hypothetical protein